MRKSFKHATSGLALMRSGETGLGPTAESGSLDSISRHFSPRYDKPIKFDGLTGDAVLRPGSAGSAPIGSPTALASHDAIPI